MLIGTPRSSEEASAIQTGEAVTAEAAFESAVAGTATALAQLDAAVRATATALAGGVATPVSPDEGNTPAPGWTGLLLLGSVALGVIALGAIGAFIILWRRR